MMISEPVSFAFASAWSSDARSTVSSSSSESPDSGRGGTLNSMLYRPSSVWKFGSAIASSTSALAIAGCQVPSTRLSSISSPVIGSLEVERVLDQHPLEDVEAPAHLRAVGLTLLARVDDGSDVVAHRWPPAAGAAGQRAGGRPATGSSQPHGGPLSRRGRLPGRRRASARVGCRRTRSPSV